MTQAAPPRLPSTERSLPIALIRARERVMAPIRAMLSSSGITEQQWRVLRVLSEAGPIDATELSDRACLLLPSLTRITRALADQGLINRTQDNTDRRKQTLTITPEGRALIEDNLAEAARIAAALKELMGQDDFDQLLSLLSKHDAFKA